MKIAQLVCVFPPYYAGMGNAAYELSARLIARGHDVTVYTPEYGGHNPANFEFAKYIKPTLSYGNAARLSGIQKELAEYDLVHLHYPFFGTAGMARKWKLENPKKPFVVTYHMDTRAPSWKGLVFAVYAKIWMPRILRAADAIIASTFDYIENSDARKIFLENKSKWHEIPFGVDTERFAPAKKPVGLFARHDLNVQSPTLLFVGGMDVAHAFKGVPILLQALRLLQETIPDIQLVLVGDGDERKKFELLARAMGISKSVRFVGRASHQELPFYYNMADILVLPSTHQGEAFGIVLIEAMGSGVPVVASDIPGVRSIAKRAGTTVERQNPVALAEAVLDYFSLSLEEQNALKTQARQVAEENFSWDHVVSLHEKLYTSIGRTL
ncbi:MAG: hypothetical protein A3B90_00655 [Candidatus Magasanikbacteria bacterium RIFCSPHIGHO2_02_FULL_41_13]|uniref:Glycosyltransferase subfamily 4-like N-terminal domain-containing protein n=1 Tax=Candidatus Magasanikbacteria bacterium RIFCSPHIGHO2_02_FULL_41_13 TaxID=1798676 RepID=A0A1F6M6W2_9BACT|nr:MAG: hypothetical protein A3B90_00655 [Candidatus Magasanikbacteria bacterium RIFCSPHIGHO2_02_FULL_41_13]